MSTTNKKKYIESHWLVFLLKGALASVAGLCLILTFQEADYVTRLVGFFMLALGVVELFNVFHRSRKQRSWGVPLAVSIVELLVASVMIFAAIPDVIMRFFPNQEYKDLFRGSVLAFRVVVLSCYTLYASVGSLIIAARSFQNRTDRFIWLIEGGVGTIMAFCMLADNGLDPNTHLRIFGIYLLVKGITDMIFGVHSRDEVREDDELKAVKKAAIAAGEAKAEKKTSKTKSAKKTSKK